MPPWIHHCNDRNTLHPFLGDIIVFGGHFPAVVSSKTTPLQVDRKCGCRQKCRTASVDLTGDAVMK